MNIKEKRKGRDKIFSLSPHTHTHTHPSETTPGSKYMLGLVPLTVK
jgi:hypothetical protein